MRYSWRQLASRGKTVCVIHRPQQKLARRRLGAEEYIVAIAWAIWSGTVSVTIPNPSVEHYQATDVGRIGEPLELTRLAAPRFTFLGTRDECRPRFCHVAVWQRDLIRVRYLDQTEVERRQTKPCRQVCCHPLACQRVLPFWIADRLQKTFASIGDHNRNARAGRDTAHEPQDLSWVPVRLWPA